VARDAISHFVTERCALEPESETSLRAPVFVTLRNQDGSLRGCVGSVVPAESNVVRETARSAVLAATRDPRFVAVEASEVPTLRIEVSVLMPEEAVSTQADLDPSRYGLIVRDGAGRQGILLPDVPGVDDGPSQIAVASRKAGIPTGTPVQLFRFSISKWEAPLP
jgi:AmmeMemoRadiSam system protein A